MNFAEMEMEDRRIELEKTNTDLTNKVGSHTSMVILQRQLVKNVILFSDLCAPHNPAM